MSTHTQGKLTAETYSGGGFDLCIDGAGTIGGGALVVASRSKHSSRPDEMHANAARLVQCWNEYDELKAQRDELLAALKAADEFIYGIRQDLHHERIADWYPEGAHNSAESMSEAMRLIGNLCADFVDAEKAISRAEVKP